MNEFMTARRTRPATAAARSAARSAARKTEGLKLALAKYGFDGLIAGIRRDEEATRAKERTSAAAAHVPAEHQSTHRSVRPPFHPFAGLSTQVVGWLSVVRQAHLWHNWAIGRTHHWGIS